MFSLIITIVAIALVVALVAATMYHGGDTLTSGRANADATAFISGAQQISGAAVMFQSLEGVQATTVAELTGKNYLANAPVVKKIPLTIDVTDTTKPFVTAAIDSDAVCSAVNKDAGLSKTEKVELGDLTGFAYGCISATAPAKGGTLRFKY